MPITHKSQEMRGRGGGQPVLVLDYSFRNANGGGLLPIMLGLAIAAHGSWLRTLVIASEQVQFSWVEPRAFREEFQARVSAVFEEVRTWAQSNSLRLEE